jgi:uncharacterized phage protein (TIGR01671 family)
MNRIIKFRGKRTDNGEWIYGNYIQAGNYKYIYPFGDLEPDGHHLLQVNDNPHWVVPETVGQFTGLHNNNGTEIYEGDIVKYVYDDDDDNILAEVRFSIEDGAYVLCNESTWIEETMNSESAENSFIIGNIHDNKDLISPLPSLNPLRPLIP